MDGTSVVREETLANGSKFAYGREADGTVTAISQSTDEGEENSTQKVYKNGQIAELRSGNNVVQYTYDDKRRLSSVNLNGTENYVKYEYSVVYDESCLYEYDEVETTNANGESVTLRKDKRGNVLSKKYSDGTNTATLTYAYDTQDKLTGVTESKNGSEVRAFGYTYDSLDKVLTYTEKENGTTKVTETYTYDEYGNVQTATQSTGMSYEYTYREDSTRALAEISVADKLSTD